MNKASACAKTILFGEHAVVYGESAIAIPLSNLRTTAEIIPNGEEFRVVSENTGMDLPYRELEPGSGIRELLTKLKDIAAFNELPSDTLHIRSKIPIASGLGSGAALSIAIIRAFSSYYNLQLTNEKINEIAFEIEKIYHGSPSGIDNTTLTYEQPLIFSKTKGSTILPADMSKFHLLVIDSGIRSKTIDVVSDVRKNYDKYKTYIHEIGELTVSAIPALESGDSSLVGFLMNENQRLLQKINVSCVELDELLRAAQNAGVPGCKLTGAGRGGNFLVLAEDKTQALRVKKIYNELGLRVYYDHSA